MVYFAFGGHLQNRGRAKAHQVPVNWSAYQRKGEIPMARKVNLWRKHYLCCLHIYCRLVDLGFSQKMAMAVAKVLAWPKI